MQAYNLRLINDYAVQSQPNAPPSSNRCWRIVTRNHLLTTKLTIIMQYAKF